MIVIAKERHNGGKRVTFENPLGVRVMAIDGTWCIDRQLIDVSKTGARIRLTSSAVNETEFFLLLTNFGDPVFRICKRRWVDGTLMGVAKEATGDWCSCKGLRAEIRVKIFKFGRPIASEGIFHAATSGPSGHCLRLTCTSNSEIAELKCLVGESGTAGAKNHPAIPREPQPSPQRVKPALAGLCSIGSDERRDEVGSALAVGP
jgi:hypothetical protein